MLRKLSVTGLAQITRKLQNKQLAGKTLTTGRGTGTRKYVAY